MAKVSVYIVLDRACETGEIEGYIRENWRDAQSRVFPSNDSLLADLVARVGHLDEFEQTHDLPDVIILDWADRERDVQQLVESLCSYSQLADIPFVVVKTPELIGHLPDRARDHATAVFWRPIDWHAVIEWRNIVSCHIMGSEPYHFSTRPGLDAQGRPKPRKAG